MGTPYSTPAGRVQLRLVGCTVGTYIHTVPTCICILVQVQGGL